MTTHVSKNALYFNHLKIYRFPRVPRMDEGRNGDIILIDSEGDDGESEPSAVGLWIKLPLSDPRAPRGTVVIGYPGATSKFPNITINDVVVTFTNVDDLDTIADNINYTPVPNIFAVNIGDTLQLSELTGGSITVSENSLGLYSSPALSEIEAHGAWAPLRISGTATFPTSGAQIFLEIPEEKTYTVLGFAVSNIVLSAITTKTDSGNIDMTVNLNGTPISGFPTITATSSRATIFSSGIIGVKIGDTLTIVMTNNDAAANLSVVIAYKNRNA